MKINSLLKKIAFLVVCIGAVYGLRVIYYELTAGFNISNITSHLSYNPHWNIDPPQSEQFAEIQSALNQEYSYLGKGCQSYVFESHDGNYVIKFIKFQRFRPQPWIYIFSFLPGVTGFQERKAIEKGEKLDKLFRSWKLSYLYLKEETGVMFVHLNKSQNVGLPILSIRDKMGVKHDIDLNHMEFLLQRKATMLQSAIDQQMAQGQQSQAMSLLDKLMAMLLGEYERGFADNDHALLQNTGVLYGRPIHIDAGQFIRNDVVKDPNVYKQEIYDKTYKLRVWLDAAYPELSYHLKARLIALLGMDYYYMGKYVHKGDVAKIPHNYPL